MTVRLDGQTIYLSGECRVEDAEPLVGLLLGPSLAHVDISGVEGLHTAVIQVLIAFKPKVIGMPAAPFLKDWIIPILQRAP